MSHGEHIDELIQMIEVGLLHFVYCEELVEMVVDEPDYEADTMRVVMRVDSTMRVRRNR